MARNPRAAAQRATAARVRANRDLNIWQRERILAEACTRRAAQANRAYADRLMAGREALPAKGSLEGKNLARLAALADQGKIDGKYLYFQDYWYHTREA